MASKTASSKSPIKSKIFLLYPYYWPLYKAGGPVQSLYNLVTTFSSKADFYVMSLNRDMDGELPEHPLDLNVWNNGPNGEKIYTTRFISPFLIFRLIREVQPDVIMVNGIFHWHTSFFGLLICKLLGHRVVISPRGMLQEWALARGKFKKLFFLKAFKWLLKKNEIWHTTDEQERKDIIKIFGADQRIYRASNIPRPLSPLTHIQFPDPRGKIKLVFLSLINPNKNLHLIIEAVNQLSDTYSLDIYGPIIDKKYWDVCERKMVNSTVSYKGSAPPWEVPKILQQYHFFVLPTQGENFGHAIFDALSSGVPVIISDRTPWKELASVNAGFYLNLEDSNPMAKVFEAISLLTSEQYDSYRKNSLKYAADFLSNKDYMKEYEFLIR